MRKFLLLVLVVLIVFALLWMTVYARQPKYAQREIKEGVELTYGRSKIDVWNKVFTAINKSGEIRYVVVTTLYATPYPFVYVAKTWEDDAYGVMCVLSSHPLAPVAGFKVYPGGRLEGRNDGLYRWDAEHWMCEGWEEAIH